MNNQYRFFPMRIRAGRIRQKNENELSLWFRFTTLILFSFFLFLPMAQAQVEDTTRTERKIPERIELNRYNNIIHTPYNMSISPSGMNQYRVFDSGTMHGFYRRLNFQGAEEFILSEDDRYDPYGSEWERELNAELMAILAELFKEQNSLLQTLTRIAPFLGFGFFERYELPPPPRIEDPDLVPVEN